MSDEDQFTSGNDQFTDVEHVSWFGRIGGACKGILVGLILFAAALPLLFWNEGRSVQEYKTLKEGGGAVVSVASDRVDPAKAGLLIHVTGKADLPMNQNIGATGQQFQRTGKRWLHNSTQSAYTSATHGNTRRHSCFLAKKHYVECTFLYQSLGVKHLKARHSLTVDRFFLC